MTDQTSQTAVIPAPYEKEMARDKARAQLKDLVEDYAHDEDVTTPIDALGYELATIHHIVWVGKLDDVKTHEDAEQAALDVEEDAADLRSRADELDKIAAMLRAADLPSADELEGDSK
jgi:hypothetical protein